MKVKRTGIILKPDPTRVLFRPFEAIKGERIFKIIARVMALSDEEVISKIKTVKEEFGNHHPKFYQFFLSRFEQVKQYLLTDMPLNDERKLLIGAYFSQEYALESAALFNPSMVWHPNQDDVLEGARRFIISLRATGEGHISSITFRSGIIDEKNKISIEEPSRFVTVPEVVPNTFYEKTLFEKKIFELGLTNEFSSRVIVALEDSFTLADLIENIKYALRQSLGQRSENENTANGMISLAQSNYEVQFLPDLNLSERIIFPNTPAELNGIEDARFVQFCGEDGDTIYYATYTAFDGKVVLPQLLETRDFLHFKISTLNGPEVSNKGMALFPRKIDGLYAMLSRQDNENLYIMFSEHLHFWYSKEIIIKPTFPWEYVQLGNCGSPIETEAGWVVLTHGVGPMRKYNIGAILLDLYDPTKVIGRLKEPLLSPDDNERVGYVPNVVYSCGGQVYGDTLILPYAMADYVSSFALVNLKDLLTELKSYN
jgi:predicted GH43/DUF377 family glycosyl hydrolase